MNDGIFALSFAAAMIASIYGYLKTDFIGFAAVAVIYCGLGAFAAVRAIRGGR